jgi:hypothetical protein
MASSCTVHSFDESVGECRACHAAFCADCLVYSHGPDKPPYCIPCAITAAGVRSTSARTKAGAGSSGRILVGLVVVAGTVAAAIPVLNILS